MNRRERVGVAGPLFYFVDAEFPCFVDAELPCFVDAELPCFVGPAQPYFVVVSSSHAWRRRAFSAS